MTDFIEQHEVKTKISFAEYKFLGSFFSFFRRWRIMKMSGK